jgi:hypothetical protein
MLRNKDLADRIIGFSERRINEARVDRFIIHRRIGSLKTGWGWAEWGVGLGIQTGSLRYECRLTMAL